MRVCGCVFACVFACVRVLGCLRARGWARPTALIACLWFRRHGPTLQIFNIFMSPSSSVEYSLSL